MTTRSKLSFRIVAIFLAASILAFSGVVSAAPPAQVSSEREIQLVSEVFVDDDFTPDTPGWNVSSFITIQEGVDAVSADGIVHVAEGSYPGQVVIAKNLSLLGAGELSKIQAVANMPICFSTSSGDHRPIVCVKDGAAAEINGFEIDGLGLGHPVNHKFSGVAFHNAGGSVIDSHIVNIHDGPYSGIQHGVAVYAFNEDGIARKITVKGNHIHDFQKNALALNASPTTPLEVDVQDNIIEGYGATNITAQNGIQVNAVMGSGVVANNTISKIAYDNTNAVTKWVATSILNFYANLQITGNTISEAHMGIYNYEGYGLIDANDITIEKVGVYAFGIIATDPPEVVPSPYEPPQVEPLNRLMELLPIHAVAITNNSIVFPAYENGATYGIEADAAFGSNDLELDIHNNDIRGFKFGLYFYQCNPANPADGNCTASRIRSISVLSNNLYDTDTAVFLSEALESEIEIHFNRIYNNKTLSGVGFLTFSTSPVNAEYNWLGCNYGPGYSGCVFIDDTMQMIDLNPWLVMSVAPLPSVPLNATTQVTIDLVHDFFGEDTSSSGNIPDGIEIDFIANRGTVTPVSARTKGGLVQATYQAPNTSGEDCVYAHLDSEYYFGGCFMVDAALELTNLDLLMSSDQTSWSSIPGGYVDGFTTAIEPSVEYYYLDTENLVTTRPLKNGSYPFIISSYPAGFFEYWDGRGVKAGATGWQGIMWQIINGDLPIFYLKVSSTGVDLIDGLQFELSGVENPLRIDGDYLPGQYSFKGEVVDTSNFVEQVEVAIEFNDIPVGQIQTVTTNEDSPVTITLAATDLYPGGLVWTTGTPGHGKLEGTAPILIYTPDADWNGSDSFIFTATDALGESATSSVSITVQPVNDPPVAEPIANATWLAREAHSLTFSPFTDIDNEGLTYNVTLANGSTLPAWLNFNPADLTLSGTPSNSNTGELTIKVSASDGIATTSTTFTLNVILNPFIYYFPIIYR